MRSKSANHSKPKFRYVRSGTVFWTNILRKGSSVQNSEGERPVETPRLNSKTIEYISLTRNGTNTIIEFCRVACWRVVSFYFSCLRAVNSTHLSVLKYFAISWNVLFLVLDYAFLLIKLVINSSVKLQLLHGSMQYQIRKQTFNISANCEKGV